MIGLGLVLTWWASVAIALYGSIKVRDILAGAALGLLDARGRRRVDDKVRKAAGCGVQPRQGRKLDRVRRLAWQRVMRLRGWCGDGMFVGLPLNWHRQGYDSEQLVPHCCNPLPVVYHVLDDASIAHPRTAAPFAHPDADALYVPVGTRLGGTLEHSVASYIG